MNGYYKNDDRISPQQDRRSASFAAEGDAYFSDGFDDLNDFEDDFSEPEKQTTAYTPPAWEDYEETLPRFEQATAPDVGSIPRRRRSPYEPEMRNLHDRQEFAPIDAASVQKERRAALRPFIICLVLMCILGAFLLSSGDLIVASSSINDHLSASLDLKIGFDAILTNVQNTAKGLPKVYTLPMNESPAQPADENNYSSYTDDNGVEHYTYIDPTITVDSWRQRYEVNGYSVMAAVSRIKIAHPTQLRTALAGGQYSSTRLKPSTISKQVNAVVAINGDLYNYNGKDTLMIRQGTVYRDSKYSYSDVLYIDSNGDFTIMRGNEAYDSGFYPSDERTIYQTITFGPPLVMDGEVVQFEMGKSGISINCFYRNPRSAIGQTGPLEYVLVAVEGRSDDSKGLTTNDLAYLMYDLGCQQAYNLDGGQSSMLIFHNKPFNHISNGGERTFSDIIYFGSAMPQE